MYCNADIVLHIRWNAQHFSVFVDNNYLDKFDHSDFLISINLFTTNPGCCQIPAEYILTRSASPLDRDEVKMDLMLANMNGNRFPVISTIIFLTMLTTCYMVHLEILPVIYWNSCVALKCQKEKSFDVSQI